MWLDHMSNVRGKKMKIIEGRIEEHVKSDEILSKYTIVSFNIEIERQSMVSRFQMRPHHARTTFKKFNGIRTQIRHGSTTMFIQNHNWVTIVEYQSISTRSRWPTDGAGPLHQFEILKTRANFSRTADLIPLNNVNTRLPEQPSQFKPSRKSIRLSYFYEAGVLWC